ncbi:MAG TPA: hypothetical protein IAD08_07415 [Candidatus Scatovivens faecipullorum]|nr:hypothetical protein [Candidatus Scatovivens faecipullorum]
MLEIFIYGIIWCFAIYGLLVMIQEITRNTTYKKIEENIKLIMTVKNVEDGIENYIREISLGRNFYNNLVIIDLDSDDDTLKILKELEKENINMKVLSKIEGKSYLEKQIS